MGRCHPNEKTFRGRAQGASRAPRFRALVALICHFITGEPMGRFCPSRLPRYFTPGTEVSPACSCAGWKKSLVDRDFTAAPRLFVIASAIRPADLLHWLASPRWERTPGRCE